MNPAVQVLLTVLGGLILAGLLWIARSLWGVQLTLALVRDQLMPDDGPSLRETVNQHTAQLAVHTMQLATLSERVGAVDHTVTETRDTITNALG